MHIDAGNLALRKSHFVAPLSLHFVLPVENKFSSTLAAIQFFSTLQKKNRRTAAWPAVDAMDEQTKIATDITSLTENTRKTPID